MRRKEHAPNCQMMNVGRWHIRVDCPNILSLGNFREFVKRCDKHRLQNKKTCGEFSMVFAGKPGGNYKVVRVSWNYKTIDCGGITIWESQYFPE